VIFDITRRGIFEVHDSIVRQVHTLLVHSIVKDVHYLHVYQGYMMTTNQVCNNAINI